MQDKDFDMQLKRAECPVKVAEIVVAKGRFQAGETRFRQMSVLELEDIEKYDVVTAIQVHHYLSEKDRRIAVEKCCRALKAGGIFSIDDRDAFGTYAGVRIPGSRVDLDVLYAGWVYGD